MLDNTWATPHLFPALTHGVDVTMMSLTKYVGGHSDAMMGSLTATPALWPRLRTAAYQLGQAVSPDDCALMLRGLRTLDVRLARHQDSALAVARWLAQQPGVARVLHPALDTDPGHPLWQRDFSGASGLFGFTIHGDKPARTRLIDALTLFGIGYSWGGFESLIVPADPQRSATARDLGGLPPAPVDRARGPRRPDRRSGPGPRRCGARLMPLRGDATAVVARLTHAMRAIGVDVGAYRLSLYGLVSTIIVVGLLFVIVRLSLRTIKWLLRRNPDIDTTQRLLIEKFAGIGLFAFAALAAVDILGIDLTALTVFSGAMGLAIGFGLQKTVGNLIAGIILLMDRSIKPDDVIVVGGGKVGSDGGVAVGRVLKIGVRAVSVVTRDGKKHLIPNELLMTEPVENWSYSSRDVRIRMKVPVGYDVDLDLAQRLMIEAARASPRVLSDPAPLVWITGFGDRAVDHELRLWIADPEAGLGNIQGEVYMAIWHSFRSHGIGFPFPRFEIAMENPREASPRS